MDLLNNIITEIINPAIYLLFGFAMVIFLYGVFQFIYKSDDEEARSAGSQHILWGIVGLAIMVCALAIRRFIASTLGVPDL